MEIETEVDVVPLDTFTRVLLLLEHEHVVVEELLQLLVGVVDEELFVSVGLEDLETSNIEHPDEGRLRGRAVQRAIDTVDEKPE